MDQLKQVSKQTLWQIIGKGVSVASTVIILGVVTRSYGESGTGVFTLALAYLSFFFLAADLGLNSYILPRIIDKEDEVNKLFNFRLIWSAVLVFVANILVYLLPFSTPLFNLSVLLGSLTIVFSGVFNSISLVFQKNLRFDQSSISSAAGSIIVIPVVLIISSSGFPVGFLVLGPLAGWVANNITAMLLVKRFYRFRLTPPSWHYPLQTLKIAWPISLTLLLNTVYFRLDSFILSSYHSFAAVGIYNFAYQFFQTALVLPTFIMNSYYPLMIKEFTENKTNFPKRLLKALGLMLLLAVGAMVVIFLLSPLALPLISGGLGFTASVEVLQILSLGFPAYFVSAVLIWTMVLLKKYQAMLLIYTVGLVVNGILNLLLIPQFSYFASAWITVVSEYLILLFQLVILWPVIFGRKQL